MYMYVQKSYVHEKIKGSKNDQKKKTTKKPTLKVYHVIYMYKKMNKNVWICIYIFKGTKKIFKKIT